MLVLSLEGGENPPPKARAVSKSPNPSSRLEALIPPGSSQALLLEEETASLCDRQGEDLASLAQVAQGQARDAQLIASCSRGLVLHLASPCPAFFPSWQSGFSVFRGCHWLKSAQQLLPAGQGTPFQLCQTECRDPWKANLCQAATAAALAHTSGG